MNVHYIVCNSDLVPQCTIFLRDHRFKLLTLTEVAISYFKIIFKECKRVLLLDGAVFDCGDTCRKFVDTLLDKGSVNVFGDVITIQDCVGLLGDTLDIMKDTIDRPVGIVINMHEAQEYKYFDDVDIVTLNEDTWATHLHEIVQIKLRFSQLPLYAQTSEFLQPMLEEHSPCKVARLTSVEDSAECVEDNVASVEDSDFEFTIDAKYFPSSNFYFTFKYPIQAVHLATVLDFWMYNEDVSHIFGYGTPYLSRLDLPDSMKEVYGRFGCSTGRWINTLRIKVFRLDASDMLFDDSWREQDILLYFNISKSKLDDCYMYIAEPWKRGFQRVVRLFCQRSRDMNCPYDLAAAIDTFPLRELWDIVIPKFKSFADFLREIMMKPDHKPVCIEFCQQVWKQNREAIFTHVGPKIPLEDIFKMQSNCQLIQLLTEETTVDVQKLFRVKEETPLQSIFTVISDNMPQSSYADCVNLLFRFNRIQHEWHDVMYIDDYSKLLLTDVDLFDVVMTRFPKDMAVMMMKVYMPMPRYDTSTIYTIIDEKRFDVIKYILSSDLFNVQQICIRDLLTICCQKQVEKILNECDTKKRLITHLQNKMETIEKMLERTNTTQTKLLFTLDHLK